MFKPEVAFYLGEQKADGYSGIVSQDNLFFCLEIGLGITEEKGHQILDFVKEKIKTTKITNLSSLDSFIIEIIREKNLPSGFSIAAGYLKNNILYLKTAGSGQIFIRRKGKLGLLIEGNNTASGPVENDDFFIFLTDSFFELVGSLSGLENTFDHRSPTQIIDEITPTLKAKSDQGAVALFVNLRIDNEVFFGGDDAINQETPLEADSETLTDKLSLVWFTMKTSKKTLTFITVFILFLVFLWSVVLGIQRRTSASDSKKIKLAKELVSQKLSTAQDVSFLNIDRAIILISESKDEVNKLKKEVGEDNKQVLEIESMVKDAESKILKKEQRKYSEFFDLTVDDQEATGDRVYLDSNTAFILDKKKGVIYRLSMEKKSLEKNKLTEIKSSDLVSGFEDISFFYVKDHGVYQIDSDNKLKKVIENDKDWGEIIDIYTFNGNIYLLDTGKDEIWKYLRAEDGYGNKSSYFQPGQSIDLSLINSFAIDGSVYLSGDSIIIKYTSGLRDGFNVELPDKNNSFNKVVASKDLDKIYLWDKSKGAVFVLGKTGEYIEQVNSDILTKANDVFVFNNNIFALSKSKIYKLD